MESDTQLKQTNVAISIVVPIYNTERYLKQCLDSVLSQDFVNFELILVDDGSTDSSIDIINNYVALDNRVKGYYIHGRGPAEPRNYGTDRANGQYIYYLDSDDYLPKGALRTLHQAAALYRKADFIKGSHLVFDGNKETLTRFAERRRPFANKELTPEEALKHIIHGHNIPCNILYRRSFLEKNNIRFDERMTYLEDGPYLMSFFSNKPISVYIDVPTYVYRLCANGSVTNTPLNTTKIKSLILGAEIYKALLEKFTGGGKTECERNMINYYTGALLGISRVDDANRKGLIKMLKRTFKTLKFSGNLYCRILILLYNINSSLALIAINCKR